MAKKGKQGDVAVATSSATQYIYNMKLKEDELLAILASTQEAMHYWKEQLHGIEMNKEISARRKLVKDNFQKYFRITERLVNMYRAEHGVPCSTLKE